MVVSMVYFHDMNACFQCSRKFSSKVETNNDGSVQRMCVIIRQLFETYLLLGSPVPNPVFETSDNYEFMKPSRLKVF